MRGAALWSIGIFGGAIVSLGGACTQYRAVMRDDASTDRATGTGGMAAGNQDAQGADGDLAPTSGAGGGGLGRDGGNEQDAALDVPVLVPSDAGLDAIGGNDGAVACAATCVGACDGQGICHAKLGQPCTVVPAGCVAGSVCSPDGYCCDSPCLGSCQACDQAGLEGRCTPVLSGPPHGSRSCAANQTCGAGECLLRDGEVCASGAACAAHVCTTFSRDADGDSYGDPLVTTGRCATPAPPSGFVTDRMDCCDDGGNLVMAARVHPGAAFQTTPADVCGIVWDFNCRSGLDTSASCTTANATACTTNSCVFVESQCGTTNWAATGCSRAPDGSCGWGGGNQGALLGCR